MKYCSSCKKIFKDETDTCPECNKKAEKVQSTDAVEIIKVKGKNISLLESALKENGVPCAFECPEGDVYNAYNLKVNSEKEYELMVPFEFYTCAFNTLLSMNLVEEEERLVEETEQEEARTESYDEKFEKKNGIKHQTWTVIWVILFIVAACLAIWGIDAIAYFIKYYFINGGAGTTETTVSAVQSMIGFF